MVTPLRTLVEHGKTIVTYQLPDSVDDVAVGGNDDFWFTSENESVEQLQLSNMQVATFPVPPSHQRGKLNTVVGVAYDAANSLTWFTTLGTTFGSVTGSGHVVTYRAPENSQTFPGAMTTGPDGRIWFTAAARAKGGALEATTPQGHVTRYPLPSPMTRPCAVATGPDGQMWTYEAGQPAIAKVTMAGAVTTYSLDPSFGGGAGCSLAVGSDGNLWFIYNGFGQQGFAIAKIAPDGSGATYFRFPLEKSWNVYDIVAAPDGNLYFSIGGGPGTLGGIGQITTAGQMTMYQVQNLGGFGPIIVAPDGHSVWTFNSSAQALQLLL